MLTSRLSLQAASFAPPAEEECTGAFRSFCPNCCLVRSVGRDPEAAMQGGRKSKGWPQDRFSSGMSRAREKALAALRRIVPFREKDTDVRRPDRATPQPQHTHATTGTPSCCHHSPHHARAWRLACTCVPSVIGAYVAASKQWLRRPPHRRTFPLACLSAGTWTRRVYLTSQVRMPWGVLLYGRKGISACSFFSATSSFSLPSPSVLPSSPLTTVSPNVFFSFAWFSGSQPGFVQKPALSEEHSTTKRGSRQEHLSANSCLKASRNSTATRTDRRFLASEVGETLASNLQREINTTETNLECW